MSRAGALYLCGALLLSACAGQEAPAPATTLPPGTSTSTTSTTEPPPPPVGTSPPNASTGEGTGPRHVSIEAFTLAGGETVGVAFHPTKAPVKLSTKVAGLEVCPGTTDGELDPSLLGWPEPGFQTCLPFGADGTVTLPAISVPTFHLGVVVRATAAAAAPVTVDALVVDYEAADGFFLVLGPPLVPGAISPDVTITPTASASIRGKATDPRSGRRWPDAISVEVLQSGRLVPSNESTEVERRGRVYGLINTGFPVTAHVRNTSEEPVSAQLWLEWT